MTKQDSRQRLADPQENYFNYFTEVEEYFVSKRGRGLLVSPLDWCLIEVWRDAGIPLFIALRGIDRSFQKSSEKRKRAPKTLFYCHPAVIEAFEEFQLGQAGAHDEDGETASGGGHSLPSQQAVGEFIDKLGAALSKLPGEAVDRASRRLQDLAREVNTGHPNLEEADRTLVEIGSLLAQSLLDSLPAPIRKALKQRVRKELRLYRKRLSPEMYARMERTHLERQVREEHGLPEFSLLDLP